MLLAVNLIPPDRIIRHSSGIPFVALDIVPRPSFPSVWPSPRQSHEVSRGRIGVRNVVGVFEGLDSGSCGVAYPMQGPAGKAERKMDRIFSCQIFWVGDGRKGGVRMYLGEGEGE